jgi:amino acid transporter
MHGTEQDAHADDAYLRSLGIEPSLKRVLSRIGTMFFAVAFVGPTTGVIFISSSAFGFMGPSVFWTVPIVGGLQILVSLLWAELVSHYPITGGVYQWARQLGGESVGFAAGLSYLVAMFLIQTTVGLGMLLVLNGLFSSIEINTTNEVIVCIALTIAVAGVSMVSVRMVSLINSVGVVMEITVLVGAAILLLFNARHPVTAVLHTEGASPGQGWIAVLLIGMAQMIVLLTGYETGGIFAEESKRSRIAPAQAIMTAATGAIFLTGVFVLGAALATPDYKAALKEPGEWIPSVLNSGLGTVGGKLFLTAAAIAVVSTGIATIAAASRIMFGMARDGQLPASRFLAKESKRSGEPVNAILVTAVFAMLPLLYASKFPVIISAAAGLLILPCLITLVALTVRRRQGWPHQRSAFSLGRWGAPLTWFGVVWLGVIVIDIYWPRDSTNPTLGPTRILWEATFLLALYAFVWWTISRSRRRPAQGSRTAEDATTVAR